MHMRYNIKTDFRKLERKDIDWIHLAGDGVQWQNFVSTVMNLPFPALTSCKVINISREAASKSASDTNIVSYIDQAICQTHDSRTLECLATQHLVSILHCC
jgi:hypothetical protein